MLPSLLPYKSTILSSEPGFQLYSWYATFHYLIERHCETLLYSYIMLHSDGDSSGNLNWTERQRIITDLSAVMKNEGRSTFHKRNFYHVSQLLERAVLQPPKVNTDIQVDVAGRAGGDKRD